MTWRRRSVPSALSFWNIFGDRCQWFDSQFWLKPSSLIGWILRWLRTRSRHWGRIWHQSAMWNAVVSGWTRPPMDCCVKSGEVEPRCSGDWEEHWARQDHLNHRQHQWRGRLRNNYLLDYPLSRRCVLDLGVFHHGRTPLQHLRCCWRLLGFCVVLFVASIPIAMQVVCTSTLALSCFGKKRQAIVVSVRHPSRNFLEWTCCAPTNRASSHRTSWLSSRSFRGVRLQRKGCCRLHCWLRSGPRTQRMSLTRCCSGASRKCRLIWTVTRLFYSPFDSAVETTESIFAACCHNCAEIKADVDAQVLSHAERDISVSRHRIFRRRWKMGFPWGIWRFQIRRDLTRKTLSLEQENSVFKWRWSRSTSSRLLRKRVVWLV